MLFMNDIKKTIIGSAKEVLDVESIEIKNAKKFIDENFAEVSLLS